MTKLNVTFVSFAAVLFSTAVFSAGPNMVRGEKLDSGLGNLSPSYTAAEFQRPAVGYRVLGESLDSGLGDLSPSYTAAEFQRSATSGYRVLGESLDSGLGELSPSYTAAEFQRAQRSYHVLGEKLDSGLGELTYQRNDIVASNKQ